METIIVIAGPTAVGKTSYSLEIAKALGGERAHDGPMHHDRAMAFAILAHI